MAKLKRSHILLIEDNNEEAEAIQRLLEQVPASVLIARNADEAIELLRPGADTGKDYERFDLIVLDMYIPLANGGDITADAGLRILVRFGFINLDCPVIVFTNHPTFDNCVKCIRAGATYYLPKMDPTQDNSRKLLELCRQYLTKVSQPPAWIAWRDEHFDELIQDFQGKWIGVLESDAVRMLKSRVKQDRLKEVGKRWVVARNTREEVEQFVLDRTSLRWTDPPILFVDQVQI